MTIPSLDGIRALSMMIVFFSHAGNGLPVTIDGVFGVTVFFFLSGYLITRLLLEEKERCGRIALGKFYGRRMLRLYPALLATLALSYLLVSVGATIGENSFKTLLSQIFYYYNYYHVAYGRAPAPGPWGTQVLWSLAVEEHFYLVWPLCLLWLWSSSRPIRAAIAFLILILAWRSVRYFFFVGDPWAMTISTDTRIDSILFGCLLAMLAHRGVASWIFPPTSAAVYVLLAAVTLATSFFLARSDAFHATVYYTLQGVALMPLFHYAVIFGHTKWTWPLNTPVMIELGRLSYGVYLSHNVFILCLQYQFWVVAAENYKVALPALALSIAWAWFLAKTLEKPAARLRRILRPVP